MNETIPAKKVYKSNHCRMCWAALGMIIALAAAITYYFQWLSKADSLFMAEYLPRTSLRTVDCA